MRMNLQHRGQCVSHLLYWTNEIWNVDSWALDVNSLMFGLVSSSLFCISLLRSSIPLLPISLPPATEVNVGHNLASGSAGHLALSAWARVCVCPRISSDVDGRFGGTSHRQGRCVDQDGIHRGWDVIDLCNWIVLTWIGWKIGCNLRHKFPVQYEVLWWDLLLYVTVTFVLGWGGGGFSASVLLRLRQELKGMQIKTPLSSSFSSIN